MKLRRLAPVLARFGRERDGVAAIEFAIVMPLFVFGTLAMTDLGLRIMALQQADAEVRLAMEGAMRYGDDIESLNDFIERNGGRTFERTAAEDPFPVASGGLPEGVSVKGVDGCKGPDGSVSYHAGNAPCERPSRWMEILGARNVAGILTEGERLETLNYVRVE